MTFHQFNGDEATKIFKFILPAKNIEEENIPKSWIQSITFIPNTYRLKQIECGPCGLLAVLQAYMLAAIKFNPEYDSKQILICAVLEIMLKLRQSFAFCIDFSLKTRNDVNPAQRYINLMIINSKEEAEYFLESNNYFDLENAAFLLMISFAFLSGPKLLSSFASHETFITMNGMTDVHFVYLLLTGKAVDIPCNECKILGGILHAGVINQQQIGILQVEDDNLSEPIGTYLTYPTYETWVVHYDGHFTSIVRKDNKFYEFDNFDKTEEECRLIELDHFSHHILMDKLKNIADYIDSH